MAEDSKIEWTDHTFNPWEGCQKVGPGCDHCYAETRNARFAGGTAVNWGPGAPRRRTSASNWAKPLAWNSTPFYECTCCGWRGTVNDPEFKTPSKGCIHDLVPTRARIFCASLADVFDNAVPVQWRMDLFELIADTPNLDWLILTKRIGNVMPMCSGDSLMFEMIGSRVWLGATIVNQAEADRDIPKLLEVPARVRFLSMEPLLGSVDLRLQRPAREDDRQDMDGWCTHITTAAGAGIHWVIVGGESGPGARPMHPDWARSLRDQCEAAGVPFLFKQWGEWMPTIHEGDTVKLVFEKNAPHGPAQPAFHDWPDGHGAARVGKKAAGRLLDGRTWDGFPAP